MLHYDSTTTQIHVVWWAPVNHVHPETGITDSYGERRRTCTRTEFGTIECLATRYE